MKLRRRLSTSQSTASLWVLFAGEATQEMAAGRDHPSTPVVLVASPGKTHPPKGCGFSMIFLSRLEPGKVKSSLQRVTHVRSGPL